MVENYLLLQACIILFDFDDFFAVRIEAARKHKKKLTLFFARIEFCKHHLYIETCSSIFSTSSLQMKIFINMQCWKIWQHLCSEISSFRSQQASSGNVSGTLERDTQSSTQTSCMMGGALPFFWRVQQYVPVPCIYCSVSGLSRSGNVVDLYTAVRHASVNQ